MRRAARIDDNQNEIVAALRKAGAFVQLLSDVGRGVPDVLCAYNGQWRLLELKDGGKAASAQRLTDVQIKWHETAKQYAPVYVVNSVAQALEVIKGDSMNAPERKTYYAHIDAFSQPDVAAPRSKAVPGVLRPEVSSRPGMNDIVDSKLKAIEMDRLDRLIDDMFKLRTRVADRLDSLLAERKQLREKASDAVLDELTAEAQKMGLYGL